MNFFETELRKVLDGSSVLKDKKYVGRACYGIIAGDIRARIEFITDGTYDHFETLLVSVINRKEGVIDKIPFRFIDIWGKQPTCNPNFTDGILPHFTSFNGKYQWYVFKPGKEDYKELLMAVDEYLSVFEPMEMEHGQKMCL